MQAVPQPPPESAQRSLPCPAEPRRRAAPPRPPDPERTEHLLSTPPTGTSARTRGLTPSLQLQVGSKNVATTA